MHTLHSSAEIDAALQASRERPIVFFKHSATCPFSARAQEQIADSKHDIEIYALVVQYARELSAELAEKLDHEHQTPQAVVVKDGEVASSYWRDEIKRDTLVTEVRGLAGGASALPRD